jgi:hypothetical protein
MLRLIVAQPEHHNHWGVTAGEWVVIDSSTKTVHGLGKTILFNVLARRHTAIKFRPYSLDEAVETAHDPTSDLFRRLQDAFYGPQQGEFLHSYGPELLVYIHGLDQLATYLASSSPAKYALSNLDRPEDLFSKRALCATTEDNDLPGLAKWYAPEFKRSDLTWAIPQRIKYTEAVRQFIDECDDRPCVSVTLTLPPDWKSLGNDALAYLLRNSAI